MTKATLPIVKTKDLKKFLATDGTITLKYLKGRPRPYRFDASRGVLNINGEIPVTSAGKAFTIIPIGYRIFSDRLFELSRREWLELFFIDESGAISIVMFHGYSVEEFMSMTQKLYYEDLSITEIAITVHPNPKESKTSGSKYFIANFEYKAAPKEYLSTVKALTPGLEIYRADTLRPSNDMIVWENYPVHLLNAEQSNGQTEQSADSSPQEDSPSEAAPK